MGRYYLGDVVLLKTVAQVPSFFLDSDLFLSSLLCVSWTGLLACVPDLESNLIKESVDALLGLANALLGRWATKLHVFTRAHDDVDSDSGF